MAVKKKSIITKATLNTPTYKNEKINDISFVNFFYGSNGTGKTTVAEELQKPANLEINHGVNLSDYNIYSYNTDFIKANFSLKNKVKAIYTAGSINVANQQRIDEIKKLTKDNKKEIEREETAIQTAKNAKDAAYKGFQKLLWTNSAAERQFFSQFMTGFLKGQDLFISKVIAAYNNRDTDSLLEDYDKLQKTIVTAFNGDDTTYPHFTLPTISIPNKDDILSTSLTTSESTEFARFVKVLNNASWLKEGHDKYHNKEGKCPYCQGNLSEDFEEKYKSCFDEDYQKSINELTLFRKDYEYQLTSFIEGLRKNCVGTLPTLDLKLYNQYIDTLEDKLKINLQLIDNKIANPEIVVELEKIDDLLTVIKGNVAVNNVLIDEHKKIIENRKNIKKRCETDAYRYLAFKFTNEIITYKDSIGNIDAEISSHETTKQTLESTNTTLADEAKQLGANVVSAGPVVEAINKTITRSGFQGFHLEWNENDKGSYQVCYNSKDDAGNYIPATRLSEGETNFIAFLYFYFTVVGTDETGSTKDSIVIIDDPVSSMDSQTLFIVSSLVKNLIDRCINASSIEEGAAIKDNNVAQIFILTHNVYFHANITPEYEDNYSAVNFYQITKNANQSHIKLRTKTKDGENYNINPIKNSYAALWRELDEVETSISACNIIHRILGYYFLNLCGYTNKKLETELLINNSDKFLKDENGNDTQERFNLVRSFLEYLDHSQNTVGNEVYFVDGVDVQTCRDTFKLVFDTMQQSQHYEMMMKHK